MSDPINQPTAPHITGRKRNRSIWMRNSIRTVERYTDRCMAEMTAWDDSPEDTATTDYATPAACAAFVLICLACTAYWFWRT